MKRGNVTWIFLVLIVMLLFVQGVRANFACGILRGDGDLSASWFNVDVYYSDNPDARTLCEVSPDEDKFCCDLNDIEGETWAIGREVTAEVSDGSYSAGPVTSVVSGEGYDVFPEMQLQRFIAVHSPNESIYVGNGVFVNVSTFGGYDDLSFLINYSGEIMNDEWGYDSEICTNCMHAEFFLEDLPYGSYELIFIARDGVGEEVRESKEFYLLEYFHFSRGLECKKCRRNLIYSGQVVDVTVGFETSHPVKGVFKDYYPGEWKFSQNSVQESITEFSDTHNEVSWAVNNSTSIKKKYSLVAPKVFFTQKYFFQSSFNSYWGEQYPVIVYWFYQFWPYPNKYLREISGVNYYSKYAQISPDNALVMNPRDDDLVMLAIFPTKELKEVYAFAHKKSPVRKSGASVNFVLGTNVEAGDISEILIRFKIKKPGFWRALDGAGFYHYDVESDSWESIESEMYNEDGIYSYFEVRVDDKGAFAIEPKYTW
ncbi:MAG: hypothetical protein ABH864_00815 [archaeon]